MLNTDLSVKQTTLSSNDHLEQNKAGALAGAKVDTQTPVGAKEVSVSSSTQNSNPIVGSHSHIDPSLRSQQDPETKQLALEQTKAARNLFYNPGEIASEQLGLAAQKLGALMDAMPSNDMKQAISARLIGNEGLMKGQTTADVRAALERVTSQSNASANDRAATVELMGGIGALFADTGATTGMQSRSETQAGQLRDYLASKVPLLNDETISAMKELGDSKVAGPLKGQQRKRPSPDAVPRLGMHDLGGAADKALGIKGKEALGSVSWQLATIDKTRVNQTTEPLSGHMSGSPSEALAAFDALLGKADEKPYVKAHTTTQAESAANTEYVQKQAFHSKDEADVKSARLAWATGYLVATGFHSSVEVAESALKYTGQNPRPDAYSGNADAANWLGAGGATSMIKELHESHTK